MHVRSVTYRWLLSLASEHQERHLPQGRPTSLAFRPQWLATRSSLLHRKHQPSQSALHHPCSRSCFKYLHKRANSLRANCKRQLAQLISRLTLQELSSQETAPSLTVFAFLMAAPTCHAIWQRQERKGGRCWRPTAALNQQAPCSSVLIFRELALPRTFPERWSRDAGIPVKVAGIWSKWLESGQSGWNLVKVAVQEFPMLPL